MTRTGKAILLATAVAGTLDLISAFVFGGMKGATPVAILQGVASGPFGDGMRAGGPTAAALGFLVHFTIMAAMCSAYMLAAPRAGWPLRRPALAGVAYGLLLYAVMYWIVLPMRFPTAFPQTGAWQVGNALFSHIVCVGLPIAFIAARKLRRT